MEELIEEIQEAKIEFKEEDWGSISKEAKDLVKNLLAKDFNKRYSPFQALAHPWIVNVSLIISHEYLINHYYYCRMEKFQQSLFQIH